MNDGYMTYWQQFQDNRKDLIQKIVLDAKRHTNTLKGARERLEWLTDHSRETGHTNFTPILREALTIVENEIETETEAILNRPLTGHEPQTVGRTILDGAEVRRLKMLLTGVICQAGGRLPIESDIQKIIGNLTDDELDRTFFDFIETNKTSGDGYIQVDRHDKEESGIPGHGDGLRFPKQYWKTDGCGAIDLNNSDIVRMNHEEKLRPLGGDHNETN